MDVKEKRNARQENQKGGMKKACEGASSGKFVVGKDGRQERWGYMDVRGKTKRGGAGM